MTDIEIQRHLAPNGQGWLLGLKQTVAPGRLDPTRRPLAIVPGFGMNAFIFGYHPRGRSMEAYLADAGFEVWSVDMRNQGQSVCDGGTRRYGLKELGLLDLGVAVDHILAHTRTTATAVDLVGCSLGATLCFIQAALARRPRVGALVCMGGPLHLGTMHPLIRAALVSPRLIGLLPFRGTRRLAEVALPLLTHVPWLLNVYLHPHIVDLSKAAELAKTVEDPNRFLNRELAEWVGTKDLFIDGRNLTEEFERRVTGPLLSVVANGDGIVPRDAALSAYEHGRMAVNELLAVGTDAVPIAHADLFISDYAEEWLFKPMSEWLRTQNAARATASTG
ncbi:MAG TPA: alpha/beta fold hydrolase [Polyangia bacterium]|jgi:pimeloyl-ACP methyl ester carboxylesterase